MQTVETGIARGARAADVVADALKRLIACEGENAAVARLRPISRQTVARLAGGMSVRAATLIVAAERLGVSTALEGDRG